MQELKRQTVVKQYASTDGLAARIRLHERYNTNPEGWWAWVFRQMHEAIGEGRKEVLEIGCGRGDLWKQNQPNLPARWNIRLSDASPAMIQAVMALELSGLREISLKDAREALSAQTDVDAVIANHMLYCLTDKDRRICLAQARDRLVHRQGVVCASTNSLRHMRELWALIEEFNPALERAVEDIRSQLSFPAFSAENGVEQLREYFSTVDWKEYECIYKVDDAELLSGFALSFPPLQEALPSEEERASLKEFLDKLIKTRGDITITSASGIFIARP